MVQYFVESLQRVADQPVALLFSLLLGVVSAASSACCTLPTLGILLGYSGTRSQNDRSSALRFSAMFTAGTIVSLVAIGLIAGFVGQVAQQSLGLYWKIFAGFVAILLGLATLKLIPLRMPAGLKHLTSGRYAALGTTALGILMGGGVAVSSLPCNPGIFIVLGAALLQGEVLWAMLLLLAYSIGFSLPLGAILLGVSLGKTIPWAQRAGNTVRYVSGVVLIFAGFYLLFSL
jgi:cytochrome c biogenesis protein CcdA